MRHVKLLLFLLFVTLIMMATLPVPGLDSQASAPSNFTSITPFPNFDIRSDHYLNIAPIKEDLPDVIKTKLTRLPLATAAQAGLQQDIADLQIRWHPLQKTPRLLFRQQRPLTTATTDAPETVARRFLGDYRGLYGLTEEIEELKVVRDYRSTHNRVHHLTLQQESLGLKVFGAEARFTINTDGEIIAVSSELVPELKGAVRSIKPTLSAHEALQLAAINVGITIDQSITRLTHRSTPDRFTTFSKGDLFENEPTAQLMLFPLGRHHVRLAWQVRFIDQRANQSYAFFVDADKGTLLLRHNLTWYFDEQPASYRVFTRHSPQPNMPFVSTNPPFVDRVIKNTDGDPTASPRGWLDVGVATTMGNNIVAQEDLNGDNIGGNRPIAMNRVFDFPITFNREPEESAPAAITNLFYQCNILHDYFYKLGFDEAAGNFQVDNFGRGGIGNDPVIADAQDGSRFNNASFSTSEDGFPGRMEMYLWTTAKPKIDGAYDSEVIVHEYVHGVTTRLVGGPQNVIALFGVQSAGMGEGWSDFYAMSILSRPGDDPRARYPFGSYVTQDFNRGVRRFAYTTNIKANPLTYADIDPTQTRFGNIDVTEIHRVGEIWCLALWEVRANFIEAYGFEQGKQMIEQLVLDGLKLSPPNPSMVDGRDAILLADQLNNNGTNQCLIWRGFANRGLGFGATAINGSSTRVHQAFDLPPYCQRTGALSFDRKGYLNGDKLKVTLGDLDLIGRESAIVTLTSLATGDRETITLSANTKLAGQFQGTVTIDFSAALAGDGKLQSALGDTITAAYADEQTEERQPAQATATARGVRTKILLSDSIENGPNNFTPDSKWQITTLFSHSLTRSWTDSPKGDYQDNINATLKVRKVDLSRLVDSRLVFWHRFDLEQDFDFAFVEVKIADQAWLPIASFTGTQREFRETILDLSRFDGKAGVKLRFRLLSDGNTNADGWYIDDVQIISGATN
ncbi:MAG: M36 family metallopeptidase [Acidobacteriota bacterium]